MKISRKTNREKERDKERQRERQRKKASKERESKQKKRKTNDLWGVLFFLSLSYIKSSSPAEHEVQTPCAELALILPAAQLVHTLAATAEYLPAAQLTQLAGLELPVLAKKVPALHLEQVVSPVNAE